ncbi:Glycosyl transferase [Cupriavidus taiwanensis]|uniref:glycosyltransferase n=1 Tax=Cupriavidus taiwanensis TaxID=164546 RepID=UPI000E1AE33D|nr:glycosyltransferase [Cupriavidus taiwanensis]SOZ13910.1 Glycosyl transferase [Cupriavidus taiwanensis]SOZ24622.1 Glycosyl transferase [Cupriavidus taiwanensis]SOZ44523.1 Glycosyl transferase [Cupriavidus taiwanensis]
MANINPLVSIVTPTFNQAKYIAETVESVLAQDYKNIEYIILDDGSTDDTQRVLEPYRARATIEAQANMGQARTLNKGWQMAKGTYLAYLSSDDILYPRAISKLVQALEADPSRVCVFPDCELIDEHSNVIKRDLCRPFHLSDLVVEQECYIGPGALFRRSAFEKAGGWLPELKLAPDREFWIRLAKFGSFHFLRETLAGYRMHPHSISYKDVSEVTAMEYIRVLDTYFADPEVPSDILARREEAYGHAYLILARNAFRSGNYSRGAYFYRLACDRHSPLRAPRYKLRLVKHVASKPARIALARLRSIVKR